MRKVVLTFGLISGAMISVFMVIGMMLMKGKTMDFGSSYVVGYGSMIISLSMVFFGIKSYRDNYLNGTIRFGKGFLVGLLIASIASLMYVATWEVYYQSDDDLRANYLDRYTEHTVRKMKEKGATDAEVEATRKQMEEMKKSYESMPFRMAITLVEIFPVGLVIVLISAAILRKKGVLPSPPEPATGNA